MIKEDVVFRSGKIRLHGTLHSPESSGPHPALVLLHSASGGTRHDPFYDHLKEHLPASGIGLLVYDRRGSGTSEGDFSTADFEQLADDGRAAFRYLAERPDIDPGQIGLYGISQGGWIAPILAAKEPDVSFLIVVSGCSLPPAEQMDYAAAYTLREAGFSEQVVDRALKLRSQVNEYFRGRIDHERIVAEVKKSEPEPWFEHAYLRSSDRLPEDIREAKWYYELDYDPLPIWQHLNHATLFIFGEKDRWVPIQASRSRYQRATSHMDDVAFFTLPGVDHLMRDVESSNPRIRSDKYMEILLEWTKARVALE